MKKSTILKITSAAGGLLVGVLAVANRMILNSAFEREAKKRPKGGTSKMGERAEAGKAWLHENDRHIVSMVNREGLTLYGHYFPCDHAKRTLIEFHGWHGSWDVEFSASSPYLHEMGCNLLLVEQRAQGRSEGKYMTFGLKEREDVMDWVTWYQEHIDENIPIYLAGLSMGATTVLMAAADPFPDEVKGIIADCGFTSAYEIIKIVSKQWNNTPEHPIMDIFRQYCKYKVGVDLKGWSTVEAVKKTELPILFVHGTGDRFVPYEMTLEAYEACQSHKDLLLVKDAAHGMSFLDAQEEYTQKVQKLFELQESQKE